MHEEGCKRGKACIGAGSTVAAKAGADAPGGGISLCFCRRGCAAPAQKAATLNSQPQRLQTKQAATLNGPRCSTKKEDDRGHPPVVLRESARFGPPG